MDKITADDMMIAFNNAFNPQDRVDFLEALAGSVYEEAVGGRSSVKRSDALIFVARIICSEAFCKESKAVRAATQHVSNMIKNTDSFMGHWPDSLNTPLRNLTGELRRASRMMHTLNIHP